MQEKLQKLEREMIKGNKSYNDLCDKRVIDFSELNKKNSKTFYWHWTIEKGDFPEMYFYATPPIAQSSESDKILITGTNIETKDMYEILKGMEVYQRVMNEIQSRRKKLPMENITVAQTGNEIVIATKSLEQYSVKPEYVFSGRVASFWERFFGEEEFLDHQERISIPRAIIGTGYMRNYNAFGGETINVRERLEEIASAWDIPIQFIESWAP